MMFEQSGGVSIVHSPTCQCLEQTLTRTTSSDTILALAIAMLLAHLFLHDYRLQVSLTSTASGAASLAAAIFASVVIASRLSSQLHVFSQVPIKFATQHTCLHLHPAEQHVVTVRGKTQLTGMVQVLLSLEVYLMLPYLLHSLHPLVSTAAAVACSLACCGLLVSLPNILRGFLTAILFVTFLCPFWLVAMQLRCASVSGQWDVADVTSVRML